MKIILLLPILSILRLCLCGGNGQGVPGREKSGKNNEITNVAPIPTSSSGSPPGASDTPSPTTTPPTTPIKNAILDITDVDLRVVTMSESFLDGMLVKKTFTPNDGCRLMEVLEMNMSIWMSSGQDGYAKSVVVHYDGDTPTSLVLTCSTADEKTVSRLYNKEQNGSWKEVDQDTLSQKHQGMKNDTPKEIPTGGVPTVQPASPSSQQPPITPVPLATLQQNGQPATQPMRKEPIEHKPKRNVTSPQNAKDHSGDVTLEKSTRNIPIVPFEEAMRELDYFREILRTKVPFPKVAEYTLDIADDKSKNLHFVKLYGEIMNGFKQKKYVPMYGKNMRTDDGTFIKVVEGSTIIWTAKPHERCGYVSCLTKDNNVVLITVAIAGRGDFIQYDRFWREGDHWKSVSVAEFQKKMIGIKVKKEKHCCIIPSCCNCLCGCKVYGDAHEAVYGIASTRMVIRPEVAMLQSGTTNLKH